MEAQERVMDVVRKVSAFSEGAVASRIAELAQVPRDEAEGILSGMVKARAVVCDGGRYRLPKKHGRKASDARTEPEMSGIEIPGGIANAKPSGCAPSSAQPPRAEEPWPVEYVLTIGIHDELVVEQGELHEQVRNLLDHGAKEVKVRVKGVP